MRDFDRVTHDPTVMGGRPCIRGMRVTVQMIIGELESGRTVEQILADFPYLEREDIEQSARFGAFLATARNIDLTDP